MVPEGWNYLPLKEAAQVIDCKHRTPSYVIDGIPVVSPGTIRWGRLDLESPTKQVSPEDFESLMDHCTVDTGDLVLSRNQTVGVASYVVDPKPFVLGQDTVLLKASSTDPRFLFYCLQSSDTQRTIYKRAGGSTFLRINLNEIRKLTILLPPVVEQRIISEILATWDRAIETVEKLIETGERQKRALLRFLTSSHRELTHNENADWSTVPLKDCAECLDSRRVPLNTEQRRTMQGDIPYYGANGVIDYINDYIFDETLVLLAEDGGYFQEFVTRPIAQLIEGKAWVNNHAHILRARSNTATEWLYYCLVHKNILAYINSGTRSKLNKSDMLQIPIPLPTLKEQLENCRVLRTACAEMDALRAQKQKLELEKLALMQQLLTGKRRLNVTGRAAEVA